MGIEIRRANAPEIGESTRTDGALTPTELASVHSSVAEHAANSFNARFRDLIEVMAVLDTEDVRQEAQLGLVDAGNRYDVTKGTPFAAYASRRVKGQLIDQLRRLSPLSRTNAKVQRQINEAWETLAKDHKQEPSTIRLQEKTGFSRRKMANASVLPTPIYLSTPLDLKDNDGETLEDNISSSDLSPEEIIIKKEMHISLLAAIRNLDSRETLLVDLYYKQRLAYREIAEFLGVSESRICQLHTKLVYKLQDALKDFAAD